MKVIDYLQQEIDAAEARKAATKARKGGKKVRCANLVKKIAKADPAPNVDLLAVLGD